MDSNYRFQNMRPLAWFLAVFSLFLTVGIIFSVASQRDLHHKMEDAHLESELALLESVIHADLLKHDFRSVQSYLIQFGSEHEDLANLSVKADDGSVLAGHARKQPALHRVAKTRRISSDRNRYVTLELIYDSGPDEQAIVAAGRRDIALSLLFAAIMGAGIWLVLRRTAFMPLERALGERDQLNATLEQRIAERTAEWVKANAELQQEIADRTAAEQELLVKERSIATSLDALRMSEARYRMIVENISEIIYMISFGEQAKGVVVFVSGQVETIVGYRGIDFLNDQKLWFSLIHPDDIASVRETTRSIIASGKGGVREFRMRSRTTGEYLWLEDKMVPQLGTSGEVTAYFGVARDITQRKEAETAMQQALVRAEEEKLKSEAIIAALGEGISIQSADYRVLYQNEKHRELIGDHIGEYCYEAFQKRSAVCLECPLVRSFADGGIHIESRSGIGERGPVHVEIITSPLRDAAGRIVAGIEVVRDFTSHKKAEEESRHSYYAQFAITTLLQLSLEDMGIDDILTQALDIILATPWLSFEAVGGIFLTAEDAPAMLTLKVSKGGVGIPRQICSRVSFGTCLCGRAAASGEMVFAGDIDERHELVCGDWGDHGHYCQPISSGGLVRGVITVMLKAGHARDSKEEGFLSAVAFALAGMIERKHIEDERRKLIIQLQATMRDIFYSKQEWQETFDSIMDMISIHDAEFRIIKANWAFARYFGLTPSEVVNKKCFDLCHEKGAPLSLCPQTVAFVENLPESQEVADPDTGRIFRVTSFPYVFPASEARGVIHVARDITQEREREMRLIMSERLASLGQLASGIAHEINNPLAAMGGCVDGLIRRIRRNEYDPDVFKRYLGIVKDEIARSKGITTDMLSFVRKSSYERGRLDLHAVLDKTLEIIGFQGRLRTVSVVRAYEDGLKPVNGSEGELRQVFLSVITNAIDAMDGAGELAVATGTEGQSAWVLISDTGPGIPAIHHSRIFDPFFTTKAETGGTGLGLAIAARIIAAHNGSIRALQEHAPGAAIKITLPLA